jgi:hypothetical protein
VTGASVGEAVGRIYVLTRTGKGPSSIRPRLFARGKGVDLPGPGPAGKGSGKGRDAPSPSMDPSHDAWRRRLRHATAACVAIPLAGGLAACGHTSPTAHSGTTTTTLGPTEQAVLTGWTAAENAYVAATIDPNGAYSPALAATMVDPELTQVRRELLGEEHSGLIGKGSLGLGHPSVVVNASASATVTSCAYDGVILVDAKTMKPAPGALGQTNHATIRSTMVLVTSSGSSEWKESASTVTEGQCAA